MKIILIYGDNEVALDNRLNLLIQEAKKGNFDVHKIDIDKSPNLIEKNFSQGLFGNGLCIFLNINKLSGKEMLLILKHIPGDLVFFQMGLINRKLLNILPKEAKIEQFKLPNVIYKFLDSFYPKNVQNCLFLLHKVIKIEPEELTLHLLGKHLHNLLLVKLDEASLDYPDWRILKLSSQAAKFNQEKLLRLIRLLSKTDVNIKSSKSGLLSSLDLLIVSELE